MSLDFKTCIDKYLVQQAADDQSHPRKIGVYYPSELTFPCLRNLYLRYEYPSVQYPADTLRTFRLGTMLHEWVEEVFQEEREEFVCRSVERSVVYETEDFQMRGRTDAVIQEKEGKTYGVELKTTKPYKFQKYIPQDDHKMQLNFYLSQLGGVDQGFLVYINKVNLNVKSFQVEFNQEILDQIVSKTEKLHSRLLAGKLPEKDKSGWSGKVCDYCHLRSQCKMEEI